jgi:excisionase family DNA binding protein
MTGRLLTARSVAGLLDVSAATVLRWTRAGDLPAVRLPSGQIRYREDELDDWINARTTTPPAQAEPQRDLAEAGR